MHLWPEDFVDNRSFCGLHSLAVAFFDLGCSSANENKVLAWLHRAGVKQFDRRALNHPIGRECAGGDAAQFDQCYGREFRHTMRK